MPVCPKKEQKGAKVGGAVGPNQFFCICSKLAHTIFLIFCMKFLVHKGTKVMETDFSGKFSFSQKMEKGSKKVQKDPKIGFLDLYAKFSH